MYGKWKAMVRMHKGNSIIALPIYAPRDTAIPLEGVAAPARFERPFYSDKELLQREAKTQESWVWNTGYGVVLTHRADADRDARLGPAPRRRHQRPRARHAAARLGA